MTGPNDLCELSQGKGHTQKRGKARKSPGLPASTSPESGDRAGFILLGSGKHPFQHGVATLPGQHTAPVAEDKHEGSISKGSFRGTDQVPRVGTPWVIK